MTYLYPFQRERYAHNWSRTLARKETLKTEIVKNGYALPPKRVPKSRRWMGTGGIVNKDCEFVPLSAMDDADNRHMMGLSYRFDKNNCPKLEGEYIYLGLFIKHWGHFIIDSATRLYCALDNPQAKCFFLLMLDQDVTLYPEQVLRAFALLGIRDRIIIINKPTQIETIIIPEQSYIRQTYYSDQYIATFDSMSANIQPTRSCAPDKVFFSRAKFNGLRRCEAGYEILDALFAAAAYTIVYPEFESLDNQIFYLNNCKSFAATAGSLIHNLMFARQAPHTAIVNKSSYINLNDMDTCKIKDVAPQYLDFYIAKYPTHNYWGPFFFFPNEIMQKYIVNCGIAAKWEAFINPESCLHLFYDYNVLYNELWPNPHLEHVTDAFALSWKHHHPALLLDWANKYARYEHRSYLAALGRKTGAAPEI